MVSNMHTNTQRVWLWIFAPGFSFFFSLRNSSLKYITTIHIDEVINEGTFGMESTCETRWTTS